MGYNGKMTEKQADYHVNNSVIRFIAQVQKVQTLADMGIRVTFDLPETAIDSATMLMKVKQAGGILEIAAVAVNE